MKSNITFAYVLFLWIFLESHDCISSQKSVWTGKQLDLYLLVDSSNSVWTEDFKRMRVWLADLVSQMDVSRGATRIGIGVYSDQHTVTLSLNNTLDAQGLREAVLATPTIRGDTYISRAIWGMLSQGLAPSLTRPGVPRVCVLLTDGQSVHKQATQDAASTARQAGIVMFTVGVGPGVDRGELRAVASDPKDKHVYLVRNYLSLGDVSGLLAKRISEVEFLQGDKSACGGTTKVDTVFVYDESAFGEQGASQVQQYINYIIGHIDMDSGNMRVGVVSRSCHTGDVSLGDYLRRDDLQSALSGRRPGPGITKLMSRARTEALAEHSGSRQDAEQRIVLFLHKPITDRQLLMEALRAHRNGVQVFVICIGSENKEATLKLSYSESEEHTLFLDSVNELTQDKAKSFFRQQFCHLPPLSTKTIEVVFSDFEYSELTTESSYSTSRSNKLTPFSTSTSQLPGLTLMLWLLNS